jgi:protein subunit release factor B
MPYIIIKFIKKFSFISKIILFKPANIEIEINPKDLKIEVKTSGGPGGQRKSFYFVLFCYS